MSEYEQMMEQLDYAIEVGCDYQFLEELKKYVEKMHKTICLRCAYSGIDSICKECKWRKS